MARSECAVFIQLTQQGRMSQDISFQRPRGTSCETRSLTPPAPLSKSTLPPDPWEDTSPKKLIHNHLYHLYPGDEIDSVTEIINHQLPTSQQKVCLQLPGPQDGGMAAGGAPLCTVVLSPMLRARLCSACPGPFSSGSGMSIWDSNPSLLAPEFLPLHALLSASPRTQVYRCVHSP